MAAPRGLDAVHRFFEGTSRSYDAISMLCTFGADRWWKQKILSHIPRNSVLVLDQACGTGILTLKIARMFPDAVVVGVDVTAEYLEVAKEKARQTGIRNVEFMLGRAEDADTGRSGFDCITSSYLAKYADLGQLVPGLGKLLKKGGALVMHDFVYPPNRSFARLWEFYFVILQRIASTRYPEWRNAFYGLPTMLRETEWVKELRMRLQENDFSAVTTEYLTIGTAAIVTARKE